MQLTVVLAAIAAITVSGLPALRGRGRAGEIVSSAITFAASIAGFAAALDTLLRSLSFSEARAWQLPLAALEFRLDPLAAAFLLPIFLLSACAAIYGLGYWPVAHHPSGPRVRCFLGLLSAGMATVVIAAHAVTFLVAWEIMAVAAFFLVSAEDDIAEVRNAAWTYLIATHIGTLALLAMFVLLRSVTGTFVIGPVTAPAGASAAIVLLALVGFGFKAGLMPFHYWLPGAHANAPSHVSALLSGAMLKVGIYGIIRTLSLFADPPAWWGALLLTLGLTSALIAILLAIGQSDLKRALAYSSIENVGVITTALGLAILGRATAHPSWVALGMAAAILHVWNHSLFKGLLFLGAGNVLHATRTRRIESLGGLVRVMPVTAATFLVGAAAASALPGANAFVSELLLYLGFLNTARDGSPAAFGAAVLALVGALAVACFVRLAGVVFLGAPRSAAATHAHEGDWTTRAPLVVLAAGCFAIGVWPAPLVAALDAITKNDIAREAIAPFAMPLALLVAASLALVIFVVSRYRLSPRVPTWDCGYAEPTARMQYTGRSFGEWITERLAPSSLRPLVEATSPQGFLPRGAALEVTNDEPFADRLYFPYARRWANRAMRLRWVQQGRLTLYLLYIFVTLLAALAWSVAAPMLKVVMR